MALGANYEQDALQALRAQPYVAPPQPTVSFSAWGTATAIPRGVATGGGESAGFFADITGAFGQVMAATDARSGGMFAGMTESERRQQAEARDKMLREGVNFSSQAGDVLRGSVSSFKPDPTTAHTAEQLVFGFTRFASKAVGYSLAGGPVVGAGLTGADEGMTASDELRQKGVALGPRSAVGLVTGVTSAAGVALPVAGNTVKQTAALVLAGGPLSFSGQQAATRYILQNAGHEKLADQYDPFDPVGLAVSTLVPAGFGAYALRGARLRAAAEAKPEAEAGEPVRTEPVSEEHVDAARVAYAADEGRRASLAPADDFRAVEADQSAQARAAEQIASGERVEVLGDLAGTRVLDVPPARLTEMARAVQEAIRPELEAAAAREAAIPARDVAMRSEPTNGPARAEGQGGDVPTTAAMVREVMDTLRAELEAENTTQRPAQARQQAEPQQTPQARAVQELEARAPDMPVRVDGVEQPMPLRELMATVREQARIETEDAGLLQVAAECFLRTGG